MEEEQLPVPYYTGSEPDLENKELLVVPNDDKPSPVLAGEPTHYRSANEHGAGCFLMIAGLLVLYTAIFLPFRATLISLLLTVVGYLLFRLFDKLL